MTGRSLSAGFNPLERSAGFLQFRQLLDEPDKNVMMILLCEVRAIGSSTMKPVGDRFEVDEPGDGAIVGVVLGIGVPQHLVEVVDVRVHSVGHVVVRIVSSASTT